MKDSTRRKTGTLKELNNHHIDGSEVYVVVPHMFGYLSQKISEKVHVINLGIMSFWYQYSIIIRYGR